MTQQNSEQPESFHLGSSIGTAESLTKPVTLHLSLKGEYFDAIKAGTKTEEYRLVTRYWRDRLDGRHYDQIVLTKGYPPIGCLSRRLTLPWRGCTVKTITHPFFGPEPVEVYAINVAPKASA
jgi:hypothetical protein